MLQIIGLAYGLVALITGKFWLGRGRMAQGTQARIAGAVLVAEPPLAFVTVLVLALAGVDMTRGISLAVELPLLIAAFVLAFRIAGQAARAQEGQVAPGAGLSGASSDQVPPAQAA